MATKKTNVLVGMPGSVVSKLDLLCGVNKRSRANLMELLIEKAHAEHAADSAARVNPITKKGGVE